MSAKKIIGYLIGIGVFGVLVYFGGRESIKTTFRPHIGFLFLSFISTFLVFIISSNRWTFIVKRLDKETKGSYLQLFFYFILSRFSGQFVSRLGGDFLVRPGLLSTQDDASLGTSVSSVFVDKFFDLLFMFLLLIPAILYIFNLIPALLLLFVTLFILGLSFYFLVEQNSVFVSTSKRALLKLHSFFSHFPLVQKIVKEEYREKIEGIEKLKILKKESLTVVLFLTLVKYIFLVGRLYFLVRALGLSIPLPILFTGIPVAQLSLLIAFTPGGLGILEGGWYGVLTMFGISNNVKTTFLIGQRAYWFIFTSTISLISYLIFGVRKFRANRQEN